MPLPSVLFSDLFTVSRAGNATVRGSDGALADIAANTARFQFASAGVPQGLVLEGVATNLALNPLWLGVVAGAAPTGAPPTGGTMGTAPTGWTFSSTTLTSQIGLSMQFVGVVTVGGEQYLSVRFYGTPTNSNLFAGQMAAAVSVLGASPFDVLMNYRLLAGSTAGVTLLAHTFAIPSGATVPSNSIISTINSSTAVEARATKAAGVGPDGTSAINLRLQCTQGVPVDITVGFGLMRILRDGRITQSPIRPTAGNAGPATRNRDDVRWRRTDWWDVARMSGGTNVGSTAMFEFTVDQTGAATEQGLLRLDDGTASNRMEFYIASGTNQVWCRRVIGGSAATTQLGTCAAGNPFRLVIAGTSAAIMAAVTGGDLTPIGLNGGTFIPARCFLGSTTTDDTTALWGRCAAALAYPLRQPNLTMLQLADTTISIAALRAEGNV